MRLQHQDGKIRTKDGQLLNGPDDACCCAPECEHCDGDLPSQYQVVIASLANGNCGSCTSINGTYVLDYVGDCVWEYVFPSNFCNYEKVQVVVGFGGTHFDVRVKCVLSSDCLDIVWRDAISTPIDCTAYSNTAVTLNQNIFYCSGSPTCHVTAL